MALSGCGGGGGGGSSGSASSVVTGTGAAPAAGPGDLQGYFPLAVGSAWVYNYSTAKPGSTVNDIATAAITGTRSVNGVVTTVLSAQVLGDATSALESYYTTSGGGLTFYGNGDATDVVTPLISPLVNLRFPVGLGSVASVSGTGLSVVEPTTKATVSVDLAIGESVTSFESVTTAAGTFANTAKLLTTVNTTLRGPGGTAQIAVTDEQWFAPGVGQVQERIVTNDGVMSTTETYGLRGYTINGVAHGLGAPQTVAGNTGPFPRTDGVGFAVSSDFTTVQPVAATDGSNTLVVYANLPGFDPLGSGTATLTYIAVMTDANGQPVSSTTVNQVPLTFRTYDPSPALSFDGKNYLLIYSVRSTRFAGYDLYAQRISRSGVLVDAQPVLLVNYGSNPVVAFDGTTQRPPAKAGGLELIRTESPDTRRLNDASVVTPAPS